MMGSLYVKATLLAPLARALVLAGFRALSRHAALLTLVLSEYSYTLETLIQAIDRDGLRTREGLCLVPARRFALNRAQHQAARGRRRGRRRPR